MSAEALAALAVALGAGWASGLNVYAAVLQHQKHCGEQIDAIVTGTGKTAACDLVLDSSRGLSPLQVAHGQDASRAR